MTHSVTNFEDAMFGGIEAILSYYEPYIRLWVQSNADKSRAPLNEEDLAQECRLAIVRCWNKQAEDSENRIKNFDLLVKRSIHNLLITISQKEHCQKRGRNKLEFFSDIVTEGGDKWWGGEINRTVDFENVLFQSSQKSYTTNESGLDSLISQIKVHLDEPRLVTTFEWIVFNYKPEDLRPQKISLAKKKKVAEELGTTEEQIDQNIEEIHFILQGYRDNFRTYSI
jgi:hypothetical protein